MYDLVIRNGTVVDGSGMPSYKADIAVSGNHIAKIGRVAEKGREDAIVMAMELLPPGRDWPP